MKLIIMHARDESHRSISLQARWVIATACVLAVCVMVLGAALQRWLWSAYPETIPASVSTHFSASATPMTQETVQALSIKVGELQASVARLDGIGRRVAEIAGLPRDRVSIVSDMPEAMVVLDELFTPTGEVVGRQAATGLERQINELAVSLARQSDYFSILDLSLTQKAASVAHIPTAMPLENFPYLSSSYGWRRHPFNGQLSMHEGLDFSAPVGTPIRAAAGGVVRTVAGHSGYGNMVEVDHGEGLLTRYAHAQVILVDEGQLVTRGQVIARVGSTGLSTGPHLHFEVRKHDKSLDPRVFLTGQPLVDAVARAPAMLTTPGVTWRPRLR